MAELKNIRIAVSGIYDYAQEEIPTLRIPMPGNGAPSWVEDKRIYKVYRPASVLATACPKFANLPLTHHHPKAPVDGQNFRDVTVGWTGANPTVDYIGETNEVGIRSTMVMGDDEALRAYENGEIQLSPGYIADFEWRKGTAPNGEDYDIIMKEITDVNHLALLPAGRGGEYAVVMDQALERETVFDIVRKKGMEDGAPKGNDNASKDHVKKEEKERTDKQGNKITQIKSVDSIPDEEFNNPTHSFELPSIATKAWKEKVGDDRPVLLKKNIMELKNKDHSEFKGIEKEIINNAVYNNDQVLYCKPDKKPNYYSVVKNGDYYDVVNIDTDPNKECNEIVDWRRINERGLEKMKRQEIKNAKAGGQSDITGGQETRDRAAALNSALHGIYDAILHYEHVKVKSIFDIARGTVFDKARLKIIKK